MTDRRLTLVSGDDASWLSPELLSRMATAAETVVDCMRELHESGSNLVMEVLRGSDGFVEWEHYPPDDVRDPCSHAQFFLHAHAPDERDRHDYAHFHTFMGTDEIPGVLPPKLARAPDNGAAITHLVAISMTATGLPERLFTTNRWVTAETWYRAPDAIAMLDRFVIGGERPVDRWITAMLVLFRPQIELLLHQRDAAVDRWRATHPDCDAYEDRRLEVTSSLDISLEAQIAWLDARLESGGEGHA
ncbi:conserved hypothetical protein [Bradyrhizobium sp. ORS 375]|uniref:DUF6969 family protein n=1 Tax=Bradyrhizobium sp. (strain ORS 375) TaxID=566679 RepID=UPI0002409632|nr:hypothetical protein [Bradyrhizobium sp. ORS 375]CCD92176.1 conserved hypothetical protein [Bradyrhizobium sp. ORS 375]